MIFIDKKILSANELKLLWWVDGNSFKKRLSYNLKTKKLKKLRKGLYIIPNQINRLDFWDIFCAANSIYSPSYISFETVLQKNWVVFQDYLSIFVASNYHKTIKIDTLQLNIQFERLPIELLLNPIWIIHKWIYSIATTERAICDTLVRSWNYYFDNLTWVNFDLLRDIWKIYCKYVPKIIDNILLLVNNHGKH